VIGRWAHLSSRGVCLIVGCLTAIISSESSCLAQEIVPAEQARPDSSEVTDRISPGGAFLRSMAFPGWGQAATGSYSRATFYFLSQAATGVMLYKTQRFLTSARERRRFWEEAAEEELIAQGVTNPDSLAAALDDDARVVSARELEEGRSQQREDWLAFGIFMLLLGGADAFVSAHLADFPEPIRVETAVLSPGPTARIEVKASIAWGGPGSNTRAQQAGRR
jgi:hypothetical protein